MPGELLINSNITRLEEVPQYAPNATFDPRSDDYQESALVSLINQDLGL
ncbi:30992_t:CDS:1, partial [Gigaspora margarita]